MVKAAGDDDAPDDAFTQDPPMLEAIPHPDDRCRSPGKRSREETVKCAVGGVDPDARGGRVRLDMGRAGPALAQLRVRPRRCPRHRKLEQGQEDEGRLH